jgi:hypothetical protein
MKRKLINFDVFERIERDSLSAAQDELTFAAPVLAKVLQAEDLKLRCYGPETVLYESVDGHFVHASYKMNEGHIEFDNVEELIINEETEQSKQRELISTMLDALLEETTSERADTLLQEFLSLPRTRRIFSEAKELRAVPVRKDGKPTGKYRKARWETTPKHSESSGKTAKRMRSKMKRTKTEPESARKLRAASRERVKRTIGEWSSLVENVIGYLEYKEYGPTLGQTEAQRDNKGNVVAVRVPTLKVRNEAKLLAFDWKTLNTDVVVKRAGGKTVSEDVDFCKAIAELKRHNNMSEDNALEETLENIVSKWSNVLYLTQDELAEQIKVALETVNAANWDDQICEFMSEGILRTAHKVYIDRVAKIMKLAGATVNEKSEDPYAEFKSTVDKFYVSLDENNRVEMQVFVDLYEAIRHVHEIALDEENQLLRTEASSYLESLLPIIQQEAEPTLEVAEDAAEWLWNIVETNLDTQDWNVSNTPHISVSGDHPAMAEKARKGYAPASDFSGNWGDVAPASDGASYTGGEADEMRNRAWGNEAGGGDTFPSLKNPYTPTPFGDYKIKGEKHVDADSGHLAHSGGQDTWPALQNPYVPQAETPQTDKMNQGREPDLVVDQ